MRRSRPGKGKGKQRAMAVVSPFPGVRYDPARAGSLAAVVAPPYDVISPAEQTALYARSPYNAVRLVLPRESDRAAASARTLREWLDAGVPSGPSTFRSDSAGRE